MTAPSPDLREALAWAKEYRILPRDGHALPRHGNLPKAVGILADEIYRLRAQAELPCGSCHPCTEWANQTWVNAGVSLPHLHTYQELLAERDALRAELASEGERRLELAAALQSDWATLCNAMAPVVRAAVGLRGVPIRTEKWKVVYPRFLAAIEKFLASGLLPDIELEDSK